MSFLTTIESKWSEFCKQTAPARKKMRKAARKTSRGVRTVWAYIYKLRGVLLAAPVAVAAICLAVNNLTKLPESVGINLLSNGEYSMMVSRGVAALCPLLVTVVCLLLTVSSRRPLYPWLISVFSLVLPLLIWVTNVFPA